MTSWAVSNSKGITIHYHYKPIIDSVWGPRNVMKLRRDVTRGDTTKVVKKGRLVNLLALRLDYDGLKALIQIGKKGAPFQVSVDDLEGEKVVGPK